MSKLVCACTIAGKPCRSGCSCANPMLSMGCLCCARYGSDEQRKVAANAIVSILSNKVAKGKHGGDCTTHVIDDAFAEYGKDTMTDEPGGAKHF